MAEAPSIALRAKRLPGSEGNNSHSSPAWTSARALTLFQLSARLLEIQPANPLYSPRVPHWDAPTSQFPLPVTHGLQEIQNLRIDVLHFQHHRFPAPPRLHLLCHLLSCLFKAFFPKRNFQIPYQGPSRQESLFLLERTLIESPPLSQVAEIACLVTKKYAHVVDFTSAGFKF